MSSLDAAWVYLSSNPLWHLTLTLLAYQLSLKLAAKSGFHPLVNPVLISIVVIIAVLQVTGADYATYFEGAQFVHFLLGPATVALAVPLYRQFVAVRRSLAAILASIITGSVTASATAVLLGYWLGADATTLSSLAPKSVTTPVAMGITEQLGGIPSLTAILVIVTGIIGASLGPLALDAAGVRAMPARGLAIGTASHGIGTARAMQVSEVAGAFSGLAMGLNAVATALILPTLWRLFFG
ncbi:MAG: LrgB family protein [Pseudomonadota bacterium]